MTIRGMKPRRESPGGLTTVRLAAAGAALCDAAEIIRLPDATHWLQHDDPDTVNTRLIEFLT